jgi:hypothetical protein
LRFERVIKDWLSLLGLIKLLNKLRFIPKSEKLRHMTSQKAEPVPLGHFTLAQLKDAGGLEKIK